MNEERVRAIIREEFAKIILIDRYLFDKNIQILDLRNIQLGRQNGTKIGTAADQLLGFYGVTPVNQPATVTDPSGGTVIDIQARSAVSALISRLKETGLIAS